MNLRKLTQMYMGWCPGVESAARFIPDRDIPPIRIATILVLAASVSVTCFYASMGVLNAVTFPSATIVSVDNGDPALALSENSIYIAMNVETTIRGSTGTGSIYHRSGVYVAKLGLDGTLENEVKIMDLGDAHNLDIDLLITGDGRWILAYEYEYGSTFVPSNLYVTSSRDGKRWDEPTVVAERVGKQHVDMPMDEREKVTVPDKPSLVEAGNGEVFLSFGVNYDMISYSVLSPENVWSSPVRIPMVADEQSCLLDENGQIMVVGANIVYDGPYVKGIAYTVLEEDGGWTEPRNLTQLSFPISGQWPRMYYSDRHGGYFLIVKDQKHPNPKIHNVYFTPDLESWNRPSTFIDMWDGYLVELPDSTLVLVFSKHPRDERGRSLSESIYVYTSVDGANWMTPVKVEQIEEEEVLDEALDKERSFVSGVISVVITALAVTAAVKTPRFGFNAITIN